MDREELLDRYGFLMTGDSAIYIMNATELYTAKCYFMCILPQLKKIHSAIHNHLDETHCQGLPTSQEDQDCSLGNTGASPARGRAIMDTSLLDPPRLRFLLSSHKCRLQEGGDGQACVLHPHSVPSSRTAKYPPAPSLSSGSLSLQISSTTEKRPLLCTHPK